MQALEVGKIYQVDSQRKGKFVGKLIHASDEWATIEITSGRADAMMDYNVRGQGEEVTVRRSFTKFTEQAAPRRYTLAGRSFAVAAEFPDDEAGTIAANQYMEAHPGVGVLAVDDGRVILASNSDKGEVVPRPAKVEG